AADLLIGHQTTGKYQEEFAGLPDWATGPGWRVTGSGKAETIYKGELDVAMSDAAKHVLVWRGVASKALDPKANPEKRQNDLDKAVAKLMKDYPPPPPK
ncbi:MAG TPA: DUF4136 domain-containing protein, partial [Terriglobales bacterium]